ncbi:MAG: DUF4760 domain-containing protein [Candidatus Eremiobacteraeota bacterium]|nr:DUF4760 domain-containing protein [Candidatus Eremiobacteraeota bacterium]MBV8222223.1 DUF4760 domain-containing protein [Candidatus Eremiobacteraeota bacterium]
MSLELVSAISSVFTAVVIGATAIAAIIQLRHMRMNNQINALLTVQAEFDAEGYRDADLLVRKEFPEILNDEGFCEYLIALLNDQPSVENARYGEARVAARLVSNIYENLGTLVKRNIFDRDLFLDTYSFIIAIAWDGLEGFVALVRATTGQQSIYENFEFIATLSKDHLAADPVTYPRGVRRLNPRVPAIAAKLLDSSSVRDVAR